MTVDVFDFFFSSPSVHQYMKPVLIPGVAHSLKYSIIQKYNTQENKGGGWRKFWETYFYMHDDTEMLPPF